LKRIFLSLVLVLAFTASASASPTYERLYFNMSNSFQDLSGNGNDGNGFGGISSGDVVGKFGQATSFDGSDDYIEVSNPSNIPSGEQGETLSFSTWIYPNDVSGDTSLVRYHDGSDGWFARIEDGDIFVRTQGGNNGGSGLSLTENTWHHIAFNWVAGSHIEVYHNGELVDNTTETDRSTISSSENLRVGAHTNKNDVLSYFYDGRIDEYRVFNDYLNSSEVANLYNYNSLKNTSEPNPSFASPLQSLESPVDRANLNGLTEFNGTSTCYSSEGCTKLELQLNNSVSFSSAGSGVKIEDSSGYDAFPDIAKAPNGTLIGVYYSGSDHTDPQGDLKITRSYDGGESWTSPSVLYESINYDFKIRNPVIHPPTPNGTMAITVVAENDSEPDNLKPVHITYSYDNGESWSNSLKEVSTDVEMDRISSDWVVKNGSIYAPFMEGVMGDPNSYSHFIMKSDDNGMSFTNYSQVTQDSDEGNEWGIANPYGDYWMAVFRNHPDTLTTWLQNSTDNAKTWSSQYNIKDETGAIGDLSLMKYDNNSVMLSGRRYDDSSTSIIFTEDGGSSWVNRTVLSSGFTNPDYGYTDSVMVNETFAKLLNYEGSGGDTDIVEYDLSFSSSFSTVNSSSNLVNNSVNSIFYDVGNLDAGSYSWRFELFQSDEQSTTSSIRSFSVESVDTTSPSINIVSPVNQTYSTSSVDLNVTSNEAVNTWEYSLDGATNQSFTPNTTLTGLSDGGHTVDVYATDSSGNTGSESVSFTVDATDTTPPTSSDNWTTSGFVDKSSATVEITASDTGGSGVEDIYYRVNGGSYSVVQGSSATVTISSQGNNTLEYYAEDSAGNVEATNTEFVALSSNEPPIARASFTKDGLTLNIQALASEDPDGSIESYEWDWTRDGTFEGSGQTSSHTYSSAGDYEIELQVTDDDGATDTLNDTISVTEPNSAPTASFTTTTNDLELGVDASGSSDSDGTISELAWDWTNDGSFETVKDESQKQGQFYNVEVVSTSNGNKYLLNGTQQKNIDLDKGVNHTFNLTSSVQGHPFHITTSSVGGNFAGIVTEGVSVTDPYNGNEHAAETGKLYYKPPVDESRDLYYQCGIHSYMGADISLSNHTLSDPTDTHTYGSEGTYNVKLRVTDNDGAVDTQVETISVSSSTNDGGDGGGGGGGTIDTTPPDTTDNWDVQGFLDKTQAAVSLSATDSGVGVDRIEYQINGNGFTSVSGNSASVDIFTEGNNTLEYYAVDNNGNEEQTQTEYVAFKTSTDGGSGGDGGGDGSQDTVSLQLENPQGDIDKDGATEINQQFDTTVNVNNSGTIELQISSENQAGFTAVDGKAIGINSDQSQQFSETLKIDYSNISDTKQVSEEISYRLEWQGDDGYSLASSVQKFRYINNIGGTGNNATGLFSGSVPSGLGVYLLLVLLLGVLALPLLIKVRLND